MSNDVNTKKFYQFLANYQTDGSSWTNVADGEYGNDDGTVIKSEFRKFMNANFEWNGETDAQKNDLINTFWKKIDTNTSASKISGTKLRNLNALDKDETANLDKKLEAYVKLNEFVASNVKIPNVLTSTGSQWKWDVVDELTLLVDEFVQGNTTGDINQMLTAAYPAIANKNTAIYCAVEYQNVLKSTILAEYPEYKIADDNTLKAILEAYTVDANAKPEDIKNDIRAIVDAYFATAGLGDDSAFDLADLGYTQDDNSALNDIQKSVLTQTIKNNLSAIKNDNIYNHYSEIIDNAIQTFIDNKLAMATYGDFENLKSIGEEDFMLSKEYKNIQIQITIDDNFKNIEVDSDFYKALVEAFGESLAQTIMLDGRYLKNSAGENIYSAILDEVYEKVSNGEFMVDGKLDFIAVQEYIIEEISKNLNNFFPNGYGDASISSLNTMYDKRAEAASKETDDNLSLQYHRDAAIDYCNALIKKGPSFQNIVEEIFGTDYKTTINEMYPSAIVSKMQELKTKALEIGDISDLKAESWQGIEDNIELPLGNEYNSHVGVVIKNKNQLVDQSRISYSLSVSGGASATIDSLGNIHIKASGVTGYSEVKIYALVDGVKIGDPKIITVKSVELLDKSDLSKITGWNEYQSEHLETYNTTNSDGKQLTESSFMDLYNQDAIIRLHISMDDSQHWDKAKSTVFSRLDQLGESIYSALSTIGLDNDILKVATDNVIKNYKNNAKGQRNDDDDGKSKSDLTRNAVNHMNKNRQSTGHQIWGTRDNDGKDSYVWVVRFKDLVDDIMQEYNKLV